MLLDVTNGFHVIFFFVSLLTRCKSSK